ncbi:MAG: 50S ribosomal protein L29 [Thaumarchaeota archaeon]|nr:50S ribosomal protein L29 [Candidatus Geocrenenecus arthurdayi]MCL7388891.1 50S ribosomal protein L29 [Candidatus Geocrenenecus arthurdayi]MCL7390645.1 50S ribosomal protein L29 [Candidatus Geocrenenecus arthurdayi]MCL7403619.1 50S ribosomal protein L29 [Candidatus Geocrenenecus arthurdayi]
MKEVKDLRQKRNEELLDELDRLRAELILLRSRTSGAGMEKTALIRNTRKRIARILTILKERGIDL